MVDPFETFPNLLSPLKIGDVLYRNRMFCAPTGHADIVANGQPSTDVMMTFERIAMGGAATVAEGEVCIDPREFSEGRWPREITRIDNYNYPRLAGACSRHGAVPSMELTFSGSGPHPISRAMAKAKGIPLEGPSEMTLYDGSKVVAMTEERIYELIDAYGKAALAAKRAGFGMVAIHAAHARAFQHWFSPMENRRTDKWGGSVENRCRFAVMAIDEIHRVCGRGFPVEIRISGTEVFSIQRDGYDIGEACRIAEQLDGHADVINVSVGNMNSYLPESFSRTHLSMFYPQGRNVEYAAEIKKHVKKSYVGTAGGLSDPYFMEEVLASGKADIIYMARVLICDPDLPNKVRTGRPEEVRKCMRCNQCFHEVISHGELACAINPEANHEREVFYSLPAPQKQRVLIIGGGIAGMQAALTASANGHEVILCEKSGELGGRILCERNVPFKLRLHQYIQRQKAAIAKANIDLRLNTEVTPEYAKNLCPDTIIAAVGSEPITPKIPGIEADNVYHAEEVFNDPALAKGKVAILGAGFVGTELAIYLAGEYGIKADIIEMLGEVNGAGNSCHKIAVVDMLMQHDIPTHFNTKAVEINARGVKCEGPEGEVFIEADTIVVAAGMKPKQEEALSFNKCARMFHMIGECKAAANIIHATGTAYTTAKFIGRYYRV